MFGEFGIKVAEIIAGVEHDIGGVFRLVNGPVIAHVFEQVLEEGIHAPGQGVQTSGPGPMDELIGQVLSPWQIVELDKRVFKLLKPDMVTDHLTGQPGMAVNRDLNVHGEPGLDADMDQSEFGVLVVIVNAAAKAMVGFDGRAVKCPSDAERRAEFLFDKDTNQPLANVIALSDGLGLRVFISRFGG